MPLPKTPAHVLELKKAAGRDSASDSALRSAIVRVANYYLRLARGKTPAEMEELIWQNASIDDTDHGTSCTLFASLTLQLGAQATGQQSWTTGGTSYPWPLRQWADVHVDPNPQSPGVISVVQDAEAHHRWHLFGDGYMPQPGDWAMFTDHVEVVTGYSGGVLYTIGCDSMPNLSVDAHQYNNPLGAQGVTGFVNNGELLNDVNQPSRCAEDSRALDPVCGQADRGQVDQRQWEQGQAAIPGLVPDPSGSLSSNEPKAREAPSSQQVGASAVKTDLPRTAATPGAQLVAASGTDTSSARCSPRYSRSELVPSTIRMPETAAQQAFIDAVAPGAVAVQRQYGIPASVTIAQAIDESGWGQSRLATEDNNLFGIKGTGPAGSDMLPTQVYENGQLVSVISPFRVYKSSAESIADHGLLLATSERYKQAMADRQSPDVFANDLTGIYATDPGYGANLITIMRLYDLYRFDAGPRTAPAAAPQTPTPGKTTTPARGASQSDQSGQHRNRQGQEHMPNSRNSPRPAKTGSEGWEQLIPTIVVIPLVTNLASSIIYDCLKKYMRRGKPTPFQFLVVNADGIIIEARVKTDDHEALRRAMGSFHRLMNPGQLYEWDDDIRNWKPILDLSEINTASQSLGSRGYAVPFSQARRMTLIPSGVGWPG